MEKRKKINKLLIIISVIGFIVWLLFSVSFFNVRNEAVEFATEGAQPIIKILEILNYRGDKLLPYFIIFFALVSFSFLFEIFLFIYSKKLQLKKTLVTTIGVITSLFIFVNSINELFLFLLLLIIVSVLVMLSIGITVKYLYVEKYDDDGKYISIKGPFRTFSQAERYANLQVNKFSKKLELIGQEVASTINAETGEGYYVNIYIKETNNRGKEHGENNE